MARLPCKSTIWSRPQKKGVSRGRNSELSLAHCSFGAVHLAAVRRRQGAVHQSWGERMQAELSAVFRVQTVMAFSTRLYLMSISQHPVIIHPWSKLMPTTSKPAVSSSCLYWRRCWRLEVASRCAPFCVCNQSTSQANLGVWTGQGKQSGPKGQVWTLALFERQIIARKGSRTLKHMRAMPRGGKTRLSHFQASAWAGWMASNSHCRNQK